MAGCREEHRFDYTGAEVSSVAISSNADWVASGHRDGSVLVWDVHSFNNTIRRLEGHADIVTSLAFAPNDERLLSGAEDTSVILWDLVTGQEIRRFTGHLSSIDGLLFNPDGLTAYSGDASNIVILWDLETGEILERFDRSPAYSFSGMGLVFSFDGSLFVSSGWEYIMAK
jgi:WD40 repeat protein